MRVRRLFGFMAVLGCALALGLAIEAARDFALAVFRYGGTVPQGIVSVYYWMTSPAHGLLNGFYWSIPVFAFCGVLWIVRAKRD